jgi:hypothetical protein
MELLLLGTCGLVAKHYVSVRHSKQEASFHEEEATTRALGTSMAPPPVDTGIGVKEHAPIPAPLGVRTLKTDEAVTPGYDQERFDSQFFPDDPNPQITDKPWMRMINAPYKPKEERVNEEPTPQDVMGTNMRKTVNRMEQDFVKNTVVSTSEKQFDRPVEPIATDNGSNIGFHIGGGQRYHKFILNDQPAIESGGGPRGAFSGGGKSDVKGEYRTITQRASLAHESVGPPTAVGVPQSSAPLPSFDITASHMEDWRLDDHSLANSKASVPRASAISKNSVSVSHDENLQVLETYLAVGNERFATGSGGNRDVQIHVPKNNDSMVGFDDRVVPNFKIGKASDKTDQEIRIRNALIPEMSQNVSALMKNRKAPVSGDTDLKNSGIDTTLVSGGTSSRGLSLQAASIPSDAFRTTDKKEVMGEAVSSSRGGASTAHPVSGMKSSGSEFRTTNSLSETVSTPFIRGGGGQRGPAVQAVHAEADRSLAEVGSFYARSGVNNHKKPVNVTSVSEFNDKKDGITSGSARKTMLPSKNKNLPVGLASNPTGSITSANMSVSLKKENGVDMIKAHQKSVLGGGVSSSRRDDDGATRNRRMGDVLNSRLGTSSALKKLLGNPYSSPAASRLPASS